MSGYRNEWSCCGDETYTQAWEPEECPFCEVNRLKSEVERLRDEKTRSQGGDIFYGHIGKYKGYAPQHDWTSRLNTCAHHGDDHEACAVYSGQAPCDVDSECLDAFILRKQAEAIDEVAEYFGGRDFADVRFIVSEHAQRLRQQADDAEA